MASTALINGVAYSWSNIKLILFGVPVVGITKIDYKIKQKKENNYGAGYEPVSRGYGNKEYEGSIEIYVDELKRIIASAPNRDLMQIPPFKIHVIFESNDGILVTEDRLLMCEFTEEGLSASQGDTKLLVSLPLVIGAIER
jgi:hypothetical protein